MADPDLDARRVGGPLQVAELEGRGGRARCVVLVGGRRAEDAVQVGALVAERQLEDVAAEPGHDLLRPPDERVELLDRAIVLVVVDPAEPDEHRIGGTKLREELAATRPDAIPDRRQQPGPDELVLERRRFRGGTGRDRDEQIVDDAEDAPGRVVRPRLGQADPVAERRDRGRVEDDLALVGMVLGLGEVVDEVAGEDVDQLDRRVADDEPPSIADRNRDLDSEPDDRPVGRGDRADPVHGLLDPEGRGRRARAIVAVEPAGDRVAREVDDVATIRVDLGDDGVEDAIEVGGQLLGPALRAELVGEGLRQRSEARDVGEQARAVDAVGHLGVVGQRLAAVAGDVRLGVVARLAARIAGRRVARRSGRQCGSVRISVRHRTPR